MHKEVEVGEGERGGRNSAEDVEERMSQSMDCFSICKIRGWLTWST
jgi:hypothetical protein